MAEAIGAAASVAAPAEPKTTEESPASDAKVVEAADTDNATDEKKDGKKKEKTPKEKQGKEKSGKEKSGKGVGKKGGGGGGRMRVPSGPMACGSGYRLNVKHFSEEIAGTDEKLKSLFEPFGAVLEAQVKTRDDGKSRGFGFVIYGTEDDAKRAVKELNGKALGGKNLFVGPAERRDDELPDQVGVKGRGKGKGDKGGDGKGAAFAAAQAAYMQQYMVMNQAYMNHYMMMGAAAAGAAASVAAQNAGTPDRLSSGGGEECPAPGEYIGVVKTTVKYGKKRYMLSCTETYQLYHHDVYLDANLLPDGAKDGDKLKFTATVKYAPWEAGQTTAPVAKGYPKAATVKKA